MKVNTLVIALFLAGVQTARVQKESTRISAESRKVISDAVNDVLRITQAPAAGDVITSSSSEHHHHHHYSAPAVVY